MRVEFSIYFDDDANPWVGELDVVSLESLTSQLTQKFGVCPAFISLWDGRRKQYVELRSFDQLEQLAVARARSPRSEQRSSSTGSRGTDAPRSLDRRSASGSRGPRSVVRGSPNKRSAGRVFAQLWVDLIPFRMEEVVASKDTSEAAELEQHIRCWAGNEHCSFELISAYRLSYRQLARQFDRECESLHGSRQSVELMYYTNNRADADVVMHSGFCLSPSARDQDGHLVHSYSFLAPEVGAEPLASRGGQSLAGSPLRRDSAGDAERKPGSSARSSVAERAHLTRNGSADSGERKRSAEMQSGIEKGTAPIPWMKLDLPRVAQDRSHGSFSGLPRLLRKFVEAGDRVAEGRATSPANGFIFSTSLVGAGQKSIATRNPMQVLLCEVAVGKAWEVSEGVETYRGGIPLGFDSVAHEVLVLRAEGQRATSKDTVAPGSSGVRTKGVLERKSVLIQGSHRALPRYVLTIVGANVKASRFATEGDVGGRDTPVRKRPALDDATLLQRSVPPSFDASMQSLTSSAWARQSAVEHVTAPRADDDSHHTLTPSRNQSRPVPSLMAPGRWQKRCGSSASGAPRGTRSLSSSLMVGRGADRTFRVQRRVASATARSPDKSSSKSYKARVTPLVPTLIQQENSLRSATAVDDATSFKCDVHGGEPLGLWCGTCRCLACPYCGSVGAHRGHSVKPVSSLVPQLLAEAQRLQLAARGRITWCKQIQRKLEHAQSREEQRQRSAVDDIRVTISDLQKLLTRKETELVRAVDGGVARSADYAQTVVQWIKHYHKVLYPLEEALEQVNLARCQGSDVAAPQTLQFVQDAPALISRLATYLEQREEVEVGESRRFVPMLNTEGQGSGESLAPVDWMSVRQVIEAIHLPAQAGIKRLIHHRHAAPPRTSANAVEALAQVPLRGSVAPAVHPSELGRQLSDIRRGHVWSIQGARELFHPEQRKSVCSGPFKLLGETWELRIHSFENVGRESDATSMPVSAGAGSVSPTVDQVGVFLYPIKHRWRMNFRLTAFSDVAWVEKEAAGWVAEYCGKGWGVFPFTSRATLLSSDLLASNDTVKLCVTPTTSLF